jgi:hypothetical protein
MVNITPQPEHPDTAKVMSTILGRYRYLPGMEMLRLETDAISVDFGSSHVGVTVWPSGEAELTWPDPLSGEVQIEHFVVGSPAGLKRLRTDLALHLQDLQGPV